MARCGAEAQRRRAHELRLSVRQHRGSELDRGTSTCSRGATRGASALCLRHYTRVGAVLDSDNYHILVTKTNSSYKCYELK
jgi:hypothetical protein